MEKVKKIVLIGASGFVGSALLNEALNRGFEVTHFDFRFHGRVSLQARYAYEVHVIHREFAQLGNLRLNEQCGFCRVKSCRKPIKCYFYNVLTYFFRILHIVGQSLCIGNKDEYLFEISRVLKLHTSAKRANIMPYVKTTCGTVAGKNNLFCIHCDKICRYKITENRVNREVRRLCI